jgi:two-component system chemotaxis response regulator CheB
VNGEPAKGLVVIGGSSGGIQAVCQILADIPSEFAWPIFVVVHIGSASALPDILSRCGKLPAIHPVDGEEFHRGRIYVAPPEKHMAIDRDRIRLFHGPRENRARPAIDPLFRSAARFFRSNVVGVILSGALDDGTAGLFAIKARRGITVVQEPGDAVAPSMPTSALAAVAVDHCLPAAEIGPLLQKLASAFRKKSALPSVEKVARHDTNNSRRMPPPFSAISIY